MDLSTGISWSFLIVVALFSYAQSSQLYLQPVKSDHAYFTGDNFFVTCFTTDENIDKLTWSDIENNRISTTEGRIHAQSAEGDQLGLRLVFTNVETEDAGTYTCSDDQDSVNFDLTVYRAVSFSDTPSVQHAPEGDTGIVLCNVKSDPKPVVNWYFEGTKISDSKGKDPKYKIHPDNHSLKIQNMSRKDAGEYKCKAFVITPLSSQVRDFDIKMHVQYIPEVIGEHKVVSYASIGMKKNLTCTITGDPVPLFEWLHDDMIIYNNTKSFVIYHTENTSTLQLVVDDEDRLGEYTCRASNPLGQKEVIIDLKEGDTPHAPEISVAGQDQGIVKLNIKSHEDKHVGEELKVTGFKVEYIFKSETWDSAIAQDFQIGESYELKNMSFNSEYVLRAAAHNAAGYGNFSDDFSYKTHSLQTASVISSDSSSLAASLVPLFSTLFFFMLL